MSAPLSARHGSKRPYLGQVEEVLRVRGDHHCIALEGFRPDDVIELAAEADVGDPLSEVAALVEAGHDGAAQHLVDEESYGVVRAGDAAFYRSGLSGRARRRSLLRPL